MDATVLAGGPPAVAAGHRLVGVRIPRPDVHQGDRRHRRGRLRGGSGSCPPMAAANSDRRGEAPLYAAERAPRNATSRATLAPVASISAPSMPQMDANRIGWFHSTPSGDGRTRPL